MCECQIWHNLIDGDVDEEREANKGCVGKNKKAEYVRQLRS